MKLFALFLCSFTLLVAGCGGDDVAGEGTRGDLKGRAKVAEVNLTRIRDAVVKYYSDHAEVPMSVTHLEDYGGGESDLEPSDDYADIGYAFFNVKFSEDGNMTQGWFIATPILDTGALKVRMNGVTGEFDYVLHDEEFAPAETTTENHNSPE